MTDPTVDPDPSVALLSDDDEIFASASMDSIQLLSETDVEWAGNGSSYDAELYDMMSHIV